MSTRTSLAAKEVTEPGAYEWVNAKGEAHIGFIRRENRGHLTGSFVAEDGCSRAVSLVSSDGSSCEGQFYGPLELSGQKRG